MVSSEEFRKPPNDGIVIGHSVVNCGEMRNVIVGQTSARAESVSTNDFKNENTVWTDSQNYGADEILFTSKNALFHKTT